MAGDTDRPSRQRGWARARLAPCADAGQGEPPGGRARSRRGLTVTRRFDRFFVRSIGAGMSCTYVSPQRVYITKAARIRDYFSAVERGAREAGSRGPGPRGQRQHRRLVAEQRAQASGARKPCPSPTSARLCLPIYAHRTLLASKRGLTVYAVLGAREKGGRAGRRKSAKARRERTRGAHLRGKSIDVKAREEERTRNRITHGVDSEVSSLY